jgi:HSP20 family molecular chaperone IbpA
MTLYEELLPSWTSCFWRIDDWEVTSSETSKDRGARNKTQWLAKAPGHDIDDWLCAESELLCPVLVEMEESEEQLTLRAQMPGFKAEEIEMSVEPHRVLISGRKE